MTNDNINIFQSIDIDSFLQKNSFSGLLSLYAFHLSFTSRKGFTLESLEKTVDFLPEKYTIAFLVFSKAIGIIEYTTNFNAEQGFYNITSYNETLGSRIQDAIYLKAKNADEQLKMNQNNTKSWESRIKDVEKYFFD